jgi:hypothetical protein
VEKLKLSRDTAHSAVGLLDRVLSVKTFERDRLQLVATSCILIAGKVEDTESRVPGLSLLERLCGRLYVTDDFKTMEILVLNVLEWKIGVVTVQSFLSHYMALGILNKSDESGMLRCTPAKLRREVTKYCLFLSELCL